MVLGKKDVECRGRGNKRLVLSNTLILIQLILKSAILWPASWILARAKITQYIHIQDTS